ncbi:hypothetical protein AK812_SmicGene28946 [Symbiodinium microadriaticum]|uniref:Uncharacterized protein n=1 Tax=Symbiodinium microadriaticum TaxID=2951 RepID=A0A1Q9D324_SYMMI|nr:hypothetical protein AK812_SmicGene28946 [Symbiodinium microadriaticum]
MDAEGLDLSYASVPCCGGQLSGLFGDLDRNETKDLRWVLDYWQRTKRRSKPGRFEEFASLYYGRLLSYFLAVIADQLKA